MTAAARIKYPGKVAECWHRGAGITETRLAVRRCCGVDVSFQQVRAVFVELAGDWA